MQKILIVGGGFSSLSASCYLKQAGYDVTILEQNDTVGGRSRQLKKEGFTFDIGPTFYWMPDVFENFFQDFNSKVEEYYSLEKLDPSYKMYFSDSDTFSVKAELKETVADFEKIEKGSGKRLKEFIKEAGNNYDLAVRNLVYKPGENIFEILTLKTLFKVNLFFKSIYSQICSLFTDPKLQTLLSFPVLFLGAKPNNTPAFYNFMNYADLKLGTWYPKGGMFSVVKGFEKKAKELGVHIKTNEKVTRLNLEANQVKSVTTDTNEYPCDILLSGADYAFTETLLPKKLRQYKESYWKSKTFAPSALLFYVGFNRKLDNITHHSLYFDTSFEKHVNSIYETKTWPEEPLFYASFPSLNDKSVAPQNKECGIFLIPIAIDLEDTQAIREKYFKLIMNRLEKLTNQKLEKDILFHESYCISDFKKDYNSYGGNAYGLANTLLQTHILRPKLKSKKVSNLYFTGQLTVPGPGVPPSIISGKVVSELIKKHYE